MLNKVIGVVAPKGSGKTTKVAELVAESDRIAVYDPMAQTDMQYRVAASEIIEHDLSAFHKAIAEDNFQILYEPAPPVQDGDEWYYPDFRPFVQKVWRRVQLIGPMKLAIDEAHYTMSKKNMPIELWNVLTNGRRYGLDIIWITQRFVGVNPWARANADEYWFFRVVHPADLDTISQTAGPEIADRVSNLRRLDATSGRIVGGEMLIWSSLDGSYRIEDCNKNPVPQKEVENVLPEPSEIESNSDDPGHSG